MVCTVRQTPLQHTELPIFNFFFKKLERIISNLFDNAIRHTPENGEIQFEIKQLETKLEVSIKDTGVGINQEELGKIFDPRYKAKNSISDTSKNIGLGLSISKKLVEILNGEIRVESKINEGACFIVCLENK